MNTKNLRNYSLAAAALVFVSCAAGERREFTVTRSWPASALRNVEVQEVDGAIVVEAGTSDTITLVADVHSRGVAARPKEENQGFFQTEIQGDVLSIGRRHHQLSMHLFGMNDLTIDYTLHVPSTIALELKTVNGRIASHGVDGTTNLTTVNGAIDLETAGTSEVEARTVNGRVDARFMKDFNGAQFKTVNGRVTATLPSTASFAGDFSQVNGDVEASFPLNIHSHPGSRRVSGDVNGGKHELRIVTVNGDIKVKSAATAAQPMAVPTLALPAAPAAPAAAPGILPPPAPPAPSA